MGENEMSAILSSPISFTGGMSDSDWRSVAGTNPNAMLRTTLSEPARQSWSGTYHLGECESLVVSVNGDPPNWVVPTLQSMGELLELPKNWDGYSARRVNPLHVIAAINLLTLVMTENTPIPSVVPTNCGGVQLEWHMNGIDLEIETLSSHRFMVSCDDSEVENEWELTADLNELIECLSRLSIRT
jgi:hypothetical protein